MAMYRSQAMTTYAATTTVQPSAHALTGAVTGAPRRWLQLEGLAALVAGAALFVGTGGPWILLVPLLFAVDISMAGYLANPRVGAFTYNLAHVERAGRARPEHPHGVVERPRHAN